MDFHFYHTQNQSQNHYPSKLTRKRLTFDQVRLLETSFITNQKPNAQQQVEIAHKLGLPSRQVAIWYQNRRARHKTQTTEMDYKNIQLKLDGILVEKKRLEIEVGILRNELQKTQEMLNVALNSYCAPLHSMSASGDDDHGSSSSPANMNYSWADGEVLPVEELYACLIGPASQQQK